MEQNPSVLLEKLKVTQLIKKILTESDRLLLFSKYPATGRHAQTDEASLHILALLYLKTILISSSQLVSSCHVLLPKF